MLFFCGFGKVFTSFLTIAQMSSFRKFTVIWFFSIFLISRSWLVSSRSLLVLALMVIMSSFDASVYSFCHDYFFYRHYNKRQRRTYFMRDICEEVDLGTSYISFCFKASICSSLLVSSMLLFLNRRIEKNAPMAAIKRK